MDFTEESKKASEFVNRYYTRISSPGQGSKQASNERKIDWQWADAFVAEFYACDVVRSQDAEALGVEGGTDRTPSCKDYVTWRAWQMAYSYWSCQVRHVDVDFWSDQVLVSVVSEVTKGREVKTFDTLHELFVLSPAKDGKIVRHVSEFVGLRLISTSWVAHP